MKKLKKGIIKNKIYLIKVKYLFKFFSSFNNITDIFQEKLILIIIQMHKLYMYLNILL